MARYQRYIGHHTNNVAEYSSLTRGLLVARGLGIRNLIVQMDSQLVVLQSSGLWATRHPTMAYYRDFVQALLHSFDWWELRHIPRERNTIADRLANDAIDQQSDGLVQLHAVHFNGTQDAVQRARQVYSTFQQHGRPTPHVTYI